MPLITRAFDPDLALAPMATGRELGISGGRRSPWRRRIIRAGRGRIVTGRRRIITRRRIVITGRRAISDGAADDRTRVTMKFYVPHEPESEQRHAFWDANLRFTTKVVFEEDFDQQQDIHRSLRTGLMPGIIYGRNEPVLIHHHQRVEAALGGTS